MAPQLLELPVEIIEKILKNLLPPLSARTVMGSSLERDLECRPKPPAELCRLMLVCKAFSSLAFPWVWRRATIRIPDKQSDYLDEDSDDEDVGYQPPDQSVSLRWYIDAGAAAHIRILNINITERHLESLSHAVTWLRPVFLLMDNIRVLKFICRINPGFKHDELDEVYNLLISKPRLHTLITTHYVPSHKRPAPYFRNLTNLHVTGNASWTFPALLQGGSPRLESLVLGSDTKDTLKLPLPWTTLREIGLVYVHTWPSLLDNFLSWKESAMSTPSPLAQLSVQAASVSRGDLVRFVSGFQSQNITSFRVSRVESIDGALLNIIADSFPQLQHLGLTDDAYDGLGCWKVELSTVSAFIGRLSRLESLYWNYVGVRLNPWQETPMYLRSQSRKILRVLGKGSRSLDNVTFYRRDESFSFVIKRDDSGGYSGYVKEKIPDDVTPWATSSWNTNSYDEI